MAATNREDLRAEAQKHFGFDFLAKVDGYLDFFARVENEDALRNAHVLKASGNRYIRFLRYLIQWCLDHQDRISVDALSEVIDRIVLPFDVSFCWCSHMLRRYAFLADIKFQTALMFTHRPSNPLILNKVTDTIADIPWRTDNDSSFSKSSTSSTKIPDEEVFGDLSGSWRELKNRMTFNLDDEVFVHRVSTVTGSQVEEFYGHVSIGQLDSGRGEATITFGSSSETVSLACDSLKMIDGKIIMKINNKAERLLIWDEDVVKNRACFDYLCAKLPAKLETGIMLRGTNLMSDQTWFLSLQEFFPDVIHERDRFLNASYREYIRWINHHASTAVLPEQGPTMDIDTWWHVHMLNPQQYQAYCSDSSRGFIKWHLPRSDQIINESTEKIIPLILRDTRSSKVTCCCG